MEWFLTESKPGLHLGQDWNWESDDHQKLKEHLLLTSVSPAINSSFFAHNLLCASILLAYRTEAPISHINMISLVQVPHSS